MLPETFATLHKMTLTFFYVISIQLVFSFEGLYSSGSFKCYASIGKNNSLYFAHPKHLFRNFRAM